MEERRHLFWVGRADRVMEALNAVVMVRDPETAGHQRRVAELSRRVAEGLGASGKEVECAYLAGLVHDVGKLVVPMRILVKPERLTPEEFGLIREHPKVGYDILRNLDLPWPVAEIVLQHHERLDGSGYPRGLRDGEILPEAKILAVADVVDAMSSHRPYRPALGKEEIIRELEEGRGKLYDPDVVDVVVDLL